jgi:hypothetical protein
MQAVLVMFRSDGERRSFSVTRDMTVIGRREDCDLRIPLGDISRKHARLVRDGDSLRLEDLGSSNGTFLNGGRVQEAVLNPGDSIQLGPVVFVLQIDGYPLDEELHPVVADMSSHPAPEPVASDSGPLSPTAQSELEDLGHLEPLPGLDEDAAAMGLEPLPSLDHDAAMELEPLPLLEEDEPVAAKAHGLPADDAMELEPLPELKDEAVHEQLAAEVSHEEEDAMEFEPLPLGEEPHEELHGSAVEVEELDKLPVEEEIAPPPAPAAPPLAAKAPAPRTPPPARIPPPVRVPPPARMDRGAPSHLEPFSMPPDEPDDAMMLGSMSGEAELGDLPEIPEIAAMKGSNGGAAPAGNPPIPLHDAEFDMETLPEIGEEESFELLPDEPEHVGHEGPIDLDMGFDSHPHPHA